MVSILHKSKLSVAVFAAVLCAAIPLRVSALSQNDFTEMKNLVLTTVHSDTCEAMARHRQAADSIANGGEITAKQLYSVLNRYGPALLYEGRHAELISFYQPVLAIFERQTKLDDTDLEQKLRIYVCLGAALEEIGMKNIAMDYYMRGIAEADPVPQIKAMLTNNIAVVYVDAHLYDKASEYFSKALEINLRLKNNKEIQLNYNNLAVVYDELGDVGKAIDCQLCALQYIDEKKSPVDFYDAQIALGALYLHRKRYNIALSYLSNGLAQQERRNYVPGILSACTELANLYVEMGENDSARYYAGRAYDIAHSSNMHAIEAKMLDIRSRIALKLGDAATAYDLLIEATQLKDSISNADNQHRLAEWERMFEIEQSKPQEGKRYGTWQVALICLAVIAVLVVATLLIYRRLSARRRTRVLAVIGRGRRANERLSNEVERLNGIITAHSINNMQSHEQINSVGNELRALLQELSPRDRATRQRIQSVLKKLDELATRDNHEEFKYIFEQANQQFYNALKRKHPDLTSRQSRICALIYLGLSTKEIADVTYREIRSVDSFRNRLRKKLGLAPDADLYAYLVQLANTSNDVQKYDEVNPSDEG